MKKLLGLAVVLVLFSLLIVACGEGKKPEPEPWDNWQSFTVNDVQGGFTMRFPTNCKVEDATKLQYQGKPMSGLIAVCPGISDLTVVTSRVPGDLTNASSDTPDKMMFNLRRANRKTSPDAVESGDPTKLVCEGGQEGTQMSIYLTVDPVTKAKISRFHYHCIVGHPNGGVVFMMGFYESKTWDGVDQTVQDICRSTTFSTPTN